MASSRTNTTGDRKGTGEIAAEETKQRRAQRGETNKKAEKAAAEGGVTPSPVPGVQPVYAAENRQDRIELVGHQYRDGEDVEPDPGYVFDAVKAKDKATIVDHVAVAGSTEGLYVEVNGKTYFFDVELGLALYRMVTGASTSLNN